MDQRSPLHSCMDELRKLAASKHRLNVSQSRSGRRPMSVDTLLKKDKDGTLFKKHGGLMDLLKTPIPGTKDWLINTGKQGLQGAATIAKKAPGAARAAGTRTFGSTTSIGADELRRLGFGDLAKHGAAVPTLAALREKLQPGDILLTRAVAPTLMSRIVSAVQGSEFGHASLYAGDGKVIDTRVSEGVFKTTLPEVHKKWGGGRDIRVYRPDATAKERAQAVERAEEYIGTPYDTVGALRLALPAGKNKGLDPKKKDAIVCSQLIVHAYPELNFAKDKNRDHVLPVDIAKSPLTKRVAELRMQKSGHKDQLEGGLADSKQPSDFPEGALRQGQRVEGEHTSNRALAREIAMDHLTEDPQYYAKLRSVEKHAFKLQGHATYQGLDIAIENRKGSTREGVDKDGKPWKTVFKVPYGYIKNTEGKDGEEIDAYVGPDKKAPNAYVVHQHHITGKGHDEDKVMLGFKSEEAARKAYLDHYNDAGPKLLGPISTLTVDSLKQKLEEKRKHTKLAWDGTGSGSGPTGNRLMPVDLDEKPDPSKPGDVPSRDGTKPGTGVKHEAGPDYVTTLPTNAAVSSSSESGTSTRL